MQRYPDFALTTEKGREFRYGLPYYTRFNTNAGETNDGGTRFIVTGTAVGQRKSTDERLCCSQAPKQKDSIRTKVGACMFGRDKPRCVGSASLAQGKEFLRHDYSQGEPCRFG